MATALLNCPLVVLKLLIKVNHRSPRSGIQVAQHRFLLSARISFTAQVKRALILGNTKYSCPLNNSVHKEALQ